MRTWGSNLVFKIPWRVPTTTQTDPASDPVWELNPNIPLILKLKASDKKLNLIDFIIRDFLHLSIQPKQKKYTSNYQDWILLHKFKFSSLIYCQKTKIQILGHPMYYFWIISNQTDEIRKNSKRKDPVFLLDQLSTSSLAYFTHSILFVDSERSSLWSIS